MSVDPAATPVARWPPRVREAAALASSVAVVALVTVGLRQVLRSTNPTSAALSLLLVVLVTATVSTLRVAVATSVVAVAFFNFWFLPPLGSFRVADPQNWAALFTLLAVSIVASRLSTRARRRTEDAMARRDEIMRLFDLTRDILLAPESPDPLAALSGNIARRFGFRRAAIALPADGGWRLHQSHNPGLVLDTRELDRAIGRAPGTLGPWDPGTVSVSSPVSISPLRAGDAAIGALAIEGEGVGAGARDAIAGVTAVAIERARLLDERREGELVRRSAELKSALLASLSHDLRTPLTALTVAAGNLNASWLSEDERRDQMEIVRVELGRLNRLFQNVVEMARIETRAIAAEREWVEPEEIVDAAARQAEYALASHRLDTDGADGRHLVHLDPRLTSSALAHVLENAAQYSPPGSPVTVSIAVSAGELTIAVRDRGEGLAPAEIDRLFDRAYRGSGACRHSFGTGMGLAITRGLLAAEGGRVSAANHPEGGAVFTIAVPVAVRERPHPEDDPS